MKAFALIALLAVIVGCASQPEQPTPTAASATPPVAGSKDALSMDNGSSATTTRNSPAEQPGASFKIEPTDKSKFPSNAAGGG